MQRWKLPPGLSECFGRWKYLLLAVLIGVLLLLPTGGSKPQTEQPQQQSGFDLADMERRLGAALSKIRGAGRVTVLLTLKESGRQVYAQNVQISDDQSQHSAVIVSRGSGVEQMVPVQQYSPTFQGALAVCSGGGDPSVRLELTEAIRALTGLSAEKISVCQGE